MTVLKCRFSYMTLYARAWGFRALATVMKSGSATILCVDDEHTALQLRQCVLESAGYKVLAAESGVRGLQMFCSEIVHAVVLDYWMADMNGLQVAQEMRKLKPRVPIIILSAYDELLDESVGIADMWIRKGQCGPQFLLDRLHDLLNGAPAPHHP